MVDRRAVEQAAQPSGGVGVAPRVRVPSRPRSIGDDLVARGIVRLDEDGVIAAVSEMRSWRRSLRLRRQVRPRPIAPGPRRRPRPHG